jgi:hypothetical protein
MRGCLPATATTWSASTSPTRRCRKHAGCRAKRAWRFSSSSATSSDYAGTFEGVWEYTCYCAIEPRRRAEYIGTVAAILRPGGWFLACFFPVRSGGGGPPFPVSKAEVRRLLAPQFRIERAGPPPRPVPRRAGQEWMVLAIKTC